MRASYKTRGSHYMDGFRQPERTQGRTYCFHMYDCSGPVTYGPTVYWDKPGFPQATTTGVDYTGDDNCDIEFHIDDGYNSSYLFSATTGRVSGEDTNPSIGQLSACLGWSTVTGDPSSVSRQANRYNVAQPYSYCTPFICYELLASGEFMFWNQGTNSNKIIINDFNLLNCAGFAFFSGVNRKSPSTRSP